MMRRAMVLLVAALALVTSAACGSDNKVGDQSLLNFKEQAGNRLGETTTTTAAPTTTTAKGAVTTTTKPKATAGAAATTTTIKAATAAGAATATTAAKPTQTVREILIWGDNDPSGATQLEPPTQTAYVGSIIRWINKDKVPRAVRADSGQFASPMIAPGASWDYTARTAGEFDYSDDTRPYVTGKLLVAKP
jgi:plastocyanin